MCAGAQSEREGGEPAVPGAGLRAPAVAWHLRAMQPSPEAEPASPEAAPPKSRPDRTAEVTRGTLRLMHALDLACLLEVPLRNGRRADILALGAGGEVWIVETKSGVEDYRVDAKWPDYRDYCDRLYFAVDESFPLMLLPESAGIIVADAYGAAIVQEAILHKLSPGRRKALTIALARDAMSRLGGLADPGLRHAAQEGSVL